jgi:hypothetical protein
MKCGRDFYDALDHAANAVHCAMLIVPARAGSSVITSRIPFLIAPLVDCLPVDLSVELCPEYSLKPDFPYENDTKIHRRLKNSRHQRVKCASNGMQHKTTRLVCSRCASSDTFQGMDSNSGRAHPGVKESLIV